jgi:hypothetical protein
MEADHLHQWVVAYNWDEWLVPMLSIADSPTTEFEPGAPADGGGITASFGGSPVRRGNER